MNYFQLLKYISNKNFIINDIELIKHSNFQNKNDIEKALINIDFMQQNHKLNKLQLIKFYYVNRFNIHNILYNLEKIIRISYNNEEEENNLSFYFYLVLLIREDESIINYSYSIEYIKKIIEILKINNDNFFNIILSKIIDELINNYKELYEYEFNKKEIEIIENINNKIINYNINILNGLTIEDFRHKKIDEIYSNIIISLIKNNKFEDYENAENIVKKLDLESIDITNKIYKDIDYTLNNDEKVKNDYNIIKIEDIFDINKINFYRILFKYILKNSYFIYTIEYLLQIKKNILKLINSQKSSFLKLKNENKIQEEKLYDLFELLLDSKYYLIKFKNLEENFSTNNDTTKINTISNNLNSTNTNELTSKENILKSKSTIPNINNNSLKPNENSDSGSKQLYNDTKNSENKTNILPVNKDNSGRSLSGMYSSGLNNETKNKSNMQNNENNSIIQFIKIIGIHKNTHKKENEKFLYYTADFIVEISDFFMSGSIFNSLIFYNSNLEETKKVQEIDNINNAFYCSKKNESVTKILVSTKKGIFVLDDKGAPKKLDKEIINNMNMNYLLGVTNSNKDNNLFFCICEDKIFLIQDLLSEIIQAKDTPIIKDKSMKSMTQINENIFAIKSNKIKSKGNDELTFLNSSNKKAFEINILNYSFSYTINGLTIMPRKKEKESEIENKVLLCACKKYVKNQRNGILLVNMQIIQETELIISKNFYKTGSFEVYCFCPLLYFKNNKILENNWEITNYFLVGGFDTKKCKGVIKLYKVNYGQQYTDNTIEYIQDIVIKNEKGEYCGYLFKGAVSCIIETNNGQIVVSCWDGNVYLFGNLNIDFYYSGDNQTKIYNDFFK